MSPAAWSLHRGWKPVDEEAKPRPRPRCVCVAARAISYCWSSDANSSFCLRSTSGDAPAADAPAPAPAAAVAAAAPDDGAWASQPASPSADDPVAHRDQKRKTTVKSVERQSRDFFLFFKKKSARESLSHRIRP